MAHEAGRRIAKHAGLPYVVDMRDPWSLVQRSGAETTSPVWRYLARRFERRAVSGAALITMNTEPAADAMRAAYPGRAGIVDVVRNGCDDEPLPPARRDARFTLRFAGSIYIDRDPRLVFRAAARLIAELGLSPDQFLIEFVGDVDKFGATPTMQIAREEGVEPFVTLRGHVKRSEALVFLAGASMLLSLPQDSDFAIPAKIYEYLRFDAWMLVLSHAGSATTRLLEGTEADVLDPTDVEGMTRVLRRRYDQFSRGERPLAAGRDGRFDRRMQSQKLMALLESSVFRRVPPRRA
jgi:glycosyltransferase involved in cell wall biosynthesis